MSDDDPELRPRRRRISGLIWAALGLLVVLAFAVLLRVVNPVAPGVGG
jgi:hypothetical protein